MYQEITRRERLASILDPFLGLRWCLNALFSVVVFVNSIVFLDRTLGTLETRTIPEAYTVLLSGD